MKIAPGNGNRGIALIIVMIVVLVFGALAAGLAYSMRVETKLARNASWDTELEWEGARSGIDLAKYVLSQPAQGGQAYDALNQKWAGGTGETNEAMMDLDLSHVEVGHCTFSVTITDCDRKFNINMAVVAPEVMNQAFILMGIDAGEVPHLTAAIQDWIDRDDNVTVGGQDTEKSYYESLHPPYSAKNGPIDDLSELLLIKGVTSPMYFGSGGGAAASRNPTRHMRAQDRNQGDEMTYPLGFRDLFTAISGRFININTADANVLQLIPDVDSNLAQAIITARNGPDGSEGNEDDMPFRSIGELMNVQGMNPQIVQMFSRHFSTRSTTFEVVVDAHIDQAHRIYHALLRRISQNQLATIYMWWE
jgi:type II secretory pathway component PulK